MARAGIFHGVETAAVSALMARVHPVAFERGDEVFAQGEPGDRLYIVVSGKVKIFRRAPGGRETLLALLGPSDMFGELAVLDPAPRTGTATAVTAVEAVAMDRALLQESMTYHPQIAEQLLRVIGRRLRRTDSALNDQIFVDVPGRVAKQLLALVQRFGARAGDALWVTHDLTQDELAGLAGVSRESVNKALAVSYPGAGSICGARACSSPTPNGWPDVPSTRIQQRPGPIRRPHLHPVPTAMPQTIPWAHPRPFGSQATP